MKVAQGTERRLGSKVKTEKKLADEDLPDIDDLRNRRKDFFENRISSSSSEKKGRRHSQKVPLEDEENFGDDQEPELTRSEVEQGLLEKAADKDLSTSRKHRSADVAHITLTEPKLLEYVRKNEWRRLYSLLVDAKAKNERIDVNTQRDNKGSGALAVAAAHNHVDTMLVLYGIGGADVEARNKNGYTPLAIAARYGRLDACRVLLKFGASTVARTDNGDTPLIVAANQVVKAARKQDEELYTNLFQICFEFIERTDKDGLDYIDEFTEEDDEQNRIKNDRTCLVIKEWIRSKGEMRDLHIPPLTVYQGSNNRELKRFFRQQHESVDISSWIKITVLLMFIYYDFVHGTQNIRLYIVLYILAYAL